MISQTFGCIQNIPSDSFRCAEIVLCDVVGNLIQILNGQRIEYDRLHAYLFRSSATDSRRPSCLSASSSRLSRALVARLPNTVWTAASKAESTEANWPLATCSRRSSSAGAVKVAFMIKNVSLWAVRARELPPSAESKLAEQVHPNNTICPSSARSFILQRCFWHLQLRRTTDLLGEGLDDDIEPGNEEDAYDGGGGHAKTDGCAQALTAGGTGTRG